MAIKPFLGKGNCSTVKKKKPYKKQFVRKMPLLLHASENGKSSLGCEACEIKPSLEGG